MNEVCKGTRCSFTGLGTINCAHFTADGVTVILKGEDVKVDLELKDLLWMEMLEEGFWITRRGSFAMILGTPPSEEVERFVAAVGRFLEKYRELVKL